MLIVFVVDVFRCSSPRTAQMERAGLAVHKNSETAKVTKDEDTGKLSLHTKAGETHGDFDVILMAIGEASTLFDCVG